MSGQIHINVINKNQWQPQNYLLAISSAKEIL